MATTKEEIAIRLGVDSRAAITGLERIQNQITKFSNDAMKKLGSIFKANVFAAATSLAQSLLPTWDDIWSKVYGVDEATTQKIQEQNDNLNRMIDNLRKAQKALKKGQEDAAFEDATSIEKLGILKDRKTAADSDVAKSQAEITRLERLLKSTTNQKYRGELIDKLGVEKTRLDEAKLEQLNAGRALKKQAGNLTPDSIETLFNQMLKDSVAQVKPLRESVEKNKALESAFTRAGNTEEAAAAKADREAATRDINKITMARQLHNLQSISDKIPSNNILNFDLFKAALITAQQEAMKVTVQKVSIVEVKAK